MTTAMLAPLIKPINGLPTLSVVVVELLSSFESPDASVTAIAEKVSRDQALSAKTLRLANSSFYGLSRKVTTIQQAIAILGFDTVRALVTAASVAEAFKSAARRESFKIHWRHGVATAVCARSLARQIGKDQNYAFICGLLHDIGRLVLVAEFEEAFSRVQAYRSEHDCHMLEAERAVFGLDHAAVGLQLAEHWKLPFALQKAISNHHAPQAGEEGGITGLLHVADVVVHALDLCKDENELVPDLNDRCWNALALHDSALFDVFHATESEYEEACQILAA